MTLLLAMGQRALKQEKLKELNRDTKALGNDQNVLGARIGSARDSFHLGISWFKKQKSVPYVEKTYKRELRLKERDKTHIAIRLDSRSTYRS